METTLYVLAFLLILITFSRYLTYLKTQLAEAIVDNEGKKNTIAFLETQLENIRLKLSEIEVNPDKSLVPIMPGIYQFQCPCNGPVRDCEVGCQTYSGFEVRHHKDCKYYPKSFSRMYDELKERAEDLEDKLRMLRDRHLELGMDYDFLEMELEERNNLKWGDKERIHYYARVKEEL